MTLREYVTWFKENWAKVGFITAIFLIIFLVVIVLPQNRLQFALLMMAPLYMLHEFDEYVIPGGFGRFMNQNVFKTDADDGMLDAPAIFWINMVAVWIIIPLFCLWGFYDIDQAIAIPYFFILQAVIHVILGIVGKRFLNPGMITAWLLHVPWGIWCIWLLVKSGDITNPFWNTGVRDALIIVAAMLVANRILAFRYKRKKMHPR